MGGDFGGFADIGGFDFGSITEFAADISSVVTDFGTEFMSALPDITAFEVPSFDVASLGGFDVAGSFAGSASWFDTFNPGAILSSIPSVSDFNLGSLTSGLPSLGSIVNNPAVVGVASSALGINPAIVSTATRALGGSGLNVGAAASALGIAGPATQPGVNLINTTAQVVTGITEPTPLTDAGLAQVLRNVNPAFVNSFVPPVATQPFNTNNPVEQVVDQYQSMYDSLSGTYSIYDRSSGETVQTGLSEQQAILAEQDLNIATPGIILNTSATATGTEDPFEAARLAAEAAASTPGPTEQDILAAGTATANGITVAQVNNARYQQAIRSLRNTKAQSTDWRVRLKLAPNANYLYKANPAQVGVLAPLAITDGIIFPYTPSIDLSYKANYESYDLTHSNYRGYFYKNSFVDAINIRGTFTAQDTKEANYLLAVIHFLRSCTKMFYGQDQQRGSPPPLVYLNGHGDYQFAEHPCVVAQFNYVLPPDVDYIRCQSNLQSNTNQLNNRLRNPIANNPLSYSVNRLLNSGLFSGALGTPAATTNNLANGNPTYVPTKMEISISLLPMQSRSQVSNNFSVKEFANGNLLKGGFW